MSLAKHPYRGWRKRWAMDAASLTLTHDTGLIVRVRGNLVEVDPDTLAPAQAAIAANEGTDEHVPARIKAYIKQARELMAERPRYLPTNIPLTPTLAPHQPAELSTTVKLYSATELRALGKS